MSWRQDETLGDNVDCVAMDKDVIENLLIGQMANYRHGREVITLQSRLSMNYVWSLSGMGSDLPLGVASGH